MCYFRNCELALLFRFEENLKQTRKFGVYKGLAIGSSVGTIYFLIFLVYSASFW